MRAIPTTQELGGFAPGISGVYPAPGDVAALEQPWQAEVGGAGGLDTVTTDGAQAVPFHGTAVMRPAAELDEQPALAQDERAPVLVADEDRADDAGASSAADVLPHADGMGDELVIDGRWMFVNDESGVAPSNGDRRRGVVASFRRAAGYVVSLLTGEREHPEPDRSRTVFARYLDLAQPSDFAAQQVTDENKHVWGNYQRKLHPQLVDRPDRVSVSPADARYISNRGRLGPMILDTIAVGGTATGVAVTVGEGLAIMAGLAAGAAVGTGLLAGAAVGRGLERFGLSGRWANIVAAAAAVAVTGLVIFGEVKLTIASTPIIAATAVGGLFMFIGAKLQQMNYKGQFWGYNRLFKMFGADKRYKPEAVVTTAGDTV